MDAIRKKMQSLKGETDVLYATIARFEGDTKEAMSVNLMKPMTNLPKL